MTQTQWTETLHQANQSGAPVAVIVLLAALSFIAVGLLAFTVDKSLKASKP